MLIERASLHLQSLTLWGRVITVPVLEALAASASPARLRTLMLLPPVGESRATIELFAAQLAIFTAAWLLRRRTATATKPLAIVAAFHKCFKVDLVTYVQKAMGNQHVFKRGQLTLNSFGDGTCESCAKFNSLSSNVTEPSANTLAVTRAFNVAHHAEKPSARSARQPVSATSAGCSSARTARWAAAGANCKRAETASEPASSARIACAVIVSLYVSAVLRASAIRIAPIRVR